MGISSEVFLAERSITASKGTGERLLFNVEASPSFRSRRSFCEAQTSLAPSADRTALRGYLGALRMTNPGIGVLVSLLADGRLEVRSIRRAAHGRGDVLGLVSLAIHMGDLSLSQLKDMGQVPTNALYDEFEEIRERFDGDKDSEHAFIVLSKNGTQKMGRHELFVEAYYTMTCRKETTCD